MFSCYLEQWLLLLLLLLLLHRLHLTVRQHAIAFINGGAFSSRRASAATAALAAMLLIAEEHQQQRRRRRRRFHRHLIVGRDLGFVNTCTITSTTTRRLDR